MNYSLNPQNFTTQYNYNSAYMQNNASIPMNTFANPHTTRHDNMCDNIELEQIETLKISIDSYHRKNHLSESNPYKFIVDFGQEPRLEQTVDGVTTKINPKGIYLNYGDSGIQRIKCLNIHSLVIPKFTTYSYNVSDFIFVGGTILKTDIRYVTLKISELVDLKKITSGDFMKNTSFTFRYDKDLGSLSHYYIPLSNTEIIYQTPLTNLKRLTVNLYDDTDTQLELPTLTYNNYANSGTSRTRSFNFDEILDELETIKEAGGKNPFTNVTGDIDDINNTISQINIIKRRHQIQIYLDIGIGTKALNKMVDYNK
jgi:hypothetical protein